MLFYLIYISKTKNPVSEAKLLEIMEQSRNNNYRLGITGMLLYIQGKFINVLNKNLVRRLEGRFIQVLEGDKSTVKALLETISSDNRHYDVVVLKEAEIKNRNFEDWSMGFQSMKLEDYLNIPNFFPLDDTFLNEPNTHKSNIPLNCLKSFYQMSKSKF